jgi:hypothetical protein
MGESHLWTAFAKIHPKNYRNTKMDANSSHAFIFFPFLVKTIKTILFLGLRKREKTND